jgi:RHS repeat-associated protein
VFVSDGLQEICEYVSGVLARSFVFGSYIDEPLAMIIPTGQPNAGKYYYHANDLYSVAALTDSAGNVVERYKYNPYGGVTVLAADGVTVRAASLYGNPWTFTGRRLDGETGLMYYRFRYYSPDLGRFISRDPIDYEGSRWNLYSYVTNRTTTRTDPQGLEEVSPGDSSVPDSPGEKEKEKKKCPPQKKICGPDITAALKAALKKIRDTFRSWDREKQTAACGKLTSYNIFADVNASNAWDILELSYRNQEWINSPPFSPPCALPHPDCKNTVEVDGQCFYAGSVNYGAFGVMTKLCGMTAKKTLGLVDAWKGPSVKWFPGLNAHPDDWIKKPSGNWQTSRDWALSGWYDWPYTRTPDGDRSQCKEKCPVQYKGPAFTVSFGENTF